MSFPAQAAVCESTALYNPRSELGLPIDFKSILARLGY
jgi:hypothetical protein